MNRETAKRVTKIFNWFDEFYERPLTDEARKSRREKQISIQKWIDENTIDEEEDNSL